MRTVESVAGPFGSYRASLLPALAVAFLLAFPSDAEGRVRCEYAGAPQNLLTVTADRDALGQITRTGPITTTGQEIWVREFLDNPRPCRGGVPTVLNTDTIRLQSRGFSFVDVLLAHGPFAPGTTPEADGASEIEIEIEFGVSGMFGEVIGTPRADEFHWGPGPENHPGLNLNPRDAGDQDVDVTVRGRRAYLIADGAAGNDTIVPAPGAPFPNDGVVSSGGRGDDRLSVPGNTSGSLEGGAGDDVLTGGRQDDSLRGGSGRDLIIGGPGRDRINSRDSRSDTVRCGPGADRVQSDQQDRLRGCEVIRRR